MGGRVICCAVCVVQTGTWSVYTFFPLGLHLTDSILTDIKQKRSLWILTSPLVFFFNRAQSILHFCTAETDQYDVMLCSCVAVLHPYRHILGLWQPDIGPYGGLLNVVVSCVSQSRHLYQDEEQ